MKREMEIMMAVALKADDFYEDAMQMAGIAKKAIGKKMGKSQLRGLNNVANSAIKISDILNFIKKQAARHEEWRKHDFSKELLKKLSVNLARERNLLCDNLNISPQEVITRQKVYLMLIREYIRQLIIHYEYALVEVR